MKTEILVPSDKAWEYGIQTVFAGGKKEIARREIEPGIGLSVYIEGFRENAFDTRSVGFGFSVEHIGMRYESEEIWHEYAPSESACEVIVADIYSAFITAEEPHEPWTP